VLNSYSFEVEFKINRLAAQAKSRYGTHFKLNALPNFIDHQELIIVKQKN